MKRKILVAGVLALALLATGCSGGSQSAQKNGDPRGGAPGKSAEENGLATPVMTESLEPTMIKETFYSLGEVEAGRTYTMMAQASADVEKVYVKVGDVVKEGDLLFKLETKDFNTTRTSQVSSAKAALDNSKITLNSAKKRYEDTLALYEQGASSKSDLDSAEDTYNTTKSNYNNALTAYNTTLSSLSSSEEDYIVTSPINGVVTARNIEEGMHATSGNGITISEYDPVKVSFRVPGARVDETYIGQPVSITFPTQDVAVEGTVTTLSMSGESGGYPAEVELSNTEGKLRPGMVAELYLETKRSENTFVVNQSVVQYDEDADGYYVFVVKDNAAVRIDVEVGIENGELKEIKGNLTQGDQIIVKGQEYLSDGDAVSVK